MNKNIGTFYSKLKILERENDRTSNKHVTNTRLMKNIQI